MYGMVNEGIHAFVVENFGREKWTEIARHAGIDTETFETMLAYPDDITYRLVGSASEVLAIPAAEVLEVFGDYWIDFASDTAIGKLLSFGGESFFEHLQNLNEMHDRIKLSLPHLAPPSFRFEQSDGDTHLLFYKSERDGLQPMVIGLLKGLARIGNEEIEIKVAKTRMDGAEEDVFEIIVKTEKDAQAA